MIILVAQFLPIDFSQENVPDVGSPIVNHIPTPTSDNWEFVETTNVVKSGSNPASFTDSIVTTVTSVNSESGIDYTVHVIDNLSML